MCTNLHNSLWYETSIIFLKMVLPLKLYTILLPSEHFLYSHNKSLDFHRNPLYNDGYRGCHSLRIVPRRELYPNNINSLPSTLIKNLHSHATDNGMGAVRTKDVEPQQRVDCLFTVSLPVCGVNSPTGCEILYLRGYKFKHGCKCEAPLEWHRTR